MTRCGCCNSTKKITNAVILKGGHASGLGDDHATDGGQREVVEEGAVVEAGEIVSEVAGANLAASDGGPTSAHGDHAGQIKCFA